MKEVFSAKNYGQYSIFVTYFSLVYLLGILGTEQGFLRFSRKLDKNVISTQKAQFYLLFSVIFLTSILSSFCFNFFYKKVPINFYLLFFSSFSMIGLLFLFNILRLNTNFVFSQITSNFWKFVLLLVSLFFYLLHVNNLKLLISIIACSTIVIFIIALAFIVSKIKIKYDNDIVDKDVFISAFHFSLSIIAFSLLTFSDRFLIEKKFSIEEFGNYFYLTNLFLAPYSILQNYIGFKQLIVFKNDFNITYFSKVIKKSLILGLLMTAFLCAIIFIGDYYNLIKFKFENYYFTIILLLITGVSKLYSSSVISAFEAITTIQTLRESNIYIILITLSILLVAIFATNSIEAILTCFIFIWISRSLIYKKLISKQLKNR